MRDRPTAPDLLDTARQVLKDRLLPALPRELAYEALMVLNAMGIAQRQCTAGDAPEREAREHVAALLGTDGPLDALERRLAADIRAGRFDPGTAGHEAAFDHLWQTTRAKAAESAPKALKGRRP